MTARKVMLLGEIGVGKSSIVKRLVFDRFEVDYKPTIGVDIYRYEVPPRPGQDAMSLIVWDTDGNFGEAIFRHVYIREASAALIIGDLTRRATVETMLRLGEGFREAIPGRYCCHILNKLDLVEHPHEFELPEELGRSTVPVLKTSAKTGANVANAFLEAADAIRRRDH
jgi:small GTP-binding protein